MKERIRQLMEAQHMNQQTFAQFTGIGSASLSSIFTGRTNPSLKHVQLIMQKFPNVNPFWLLQGMGGMFNISGANSGDSATENSTPNVSDGTDALPTSQSSQNNDFQGDLFSSANLSAQPSLFDSATSTPSKPASSQISQNGKRNVSGIQINQPQQRGYAQQQNGRPQQGAYPQQVIESPTPQRKITEIRIFYDDQTWESFVPKK